MKKIKIYISGGMSGLPSMNYPAFFKAEEELLSYKRFTVVNPARHFNGDKTLPYATYLRKDISELLKCQAIFMLEGWEDSRGATLEHGIATALGLQIIYDSGKKPVKKELTILEEAGNIVNGQRRKDYGHPSIQFGRLAGLASIIFEKEITKMQVGMFLIALKISRLMHSYTRDSLVDCCGYAQCIELIQQQEKENNGTANQ